jgi:general secretion pathway protein S
MNHATRLCIFIGFAIVLSGCQQKTPSRAIQPEQLNQIAALVAGSHWTRDYCQRSDIPERQVLLRSAINQAEKRGWNIKHTATQTLTNIINQRYDALSMDSQSTSQKCVALNVALAPFLQKITSA